MFQKLVGAFFGEGELRLGLVAVGAAIGVTAIVIDRVALEPRNTKFRLHAMPLAVGMYLPWTVTFPILIGGVAYKLVERRSIARGDSDDTRQSVIHRGLLFGSGLVAGEAIMGILIAVLYMFQLDIPFFPDWQAGNIPWLPGSFGGLLLDFVSLGALFIVIRMMMRKALAR